MNFKSKKEQLDIAKTTTCPNILEKLHNSQYMNVRRAVARNLNISTQVANTLVTDPVLNVSYMALKNPKSTVNRDLCNRSIVGCVVCEKDERELDCTTCEEKNKSFIKKKKKKKFSFFSS